MMILLILSYLVLIINITANHYYHIIQKALEDAYRVLRPGGKIMILEFSHLESALLQKAYDEYSFRVIPPLGQLVAGDAPSYQYLVESIRKFPKQVHLQLLHN